MCSTSDSSAFIALNICRCCHSFGFYTDISTEFNTSEGQEIYEDVLSKTFNIQLNSFINGVVQSSKQICYDCISKLQEAYAFRNMVLANESKMLAYFESVQNDKSVNLNNFNQYEHTITNTEVLVKEECVDVHNEYVENETSDVFFDDDVYVKEEPVEGHCEGVTEPPSILSAEGIKSNTFKVEATNGPDSYSEYKSETPEPSTKKKICMETVHKGCTIYFKQDFKPSENHISDNGIRRSNKAPKTSVERSREYRKRKAMLREKNKKNLEKNTTVDPLEDNLSAERRKIEKRIKAREATRRWRERKQKMIQKKQAKTSTERMREYRERKRLAKELKEQSQYIDVILST